MVVVKAAFPTNYREVPTAAPVVEPMVDFNAPGVGLKGGEQNFIFIFCQVLSMNVPKENQLRFFL